MSGVKQDDPGDASGPRAHEQSPEAVSALRVSPAIALWQPIASAPKDGTSVLVWDADCVVCLVGEWYGGGWRVAWDGEPNPDFTHWMPLPAPPEA